MFMIQLTGLYSYIVYVSVFTFMLYKFIIIQLEGEGSTYHPTVTPQMWFIMPGQLRGVLVINNSNFNLQKTQVPTYEANYVYAYI